MFKILLFGFLIVSDLISSIYNFKEIRYSDAIGRSIEMQGQIEFLKDGLNIFYPKTSKSLEYKDNFLKYIDDAKEIDLQESQKEQIKVYFDILILLHNGDEEAMDEMFEITRDAKTIVLKPKADIKNYITKIELLKPNKQLKSVKLFLKNSDNITINIDDEIR